MASILFVEDSQQWQGLVRELLETAGHKMKGVPTFQAALDVVGGKETFDAIIFDLRLEATSEGHDPYVWLEAFIQGAEARKLSLAPIIVVTGIPIEKGDVVRAFTKYREHVFHFFEKGSFDPRDLLDSIKEAALQRRRFGGARSFLQITAYAAVAMVVLAGVFWILLWTIGQIADPKTQQTALQVGGAVLVAFVVFIGILSRETELMSVPRRIKDIFG